MKSSVSGLILFLLATACQAGEPIYTNKTRFRIPYRYDAAEMQRLGAQQIQLFISTDRGTRWQMAQSVAPDTGSFDFQAPSDGEYWFSVRTLDFNRQLHPAGNFEPGLKVIVDTQVPRLNLTLRQLAAGRVEVSWQANDLHLDPNRLQLEYVQTGATQWKPLQIQQTASGNLSWTVPSGGMVAVRGTIGDKAANIARAQQQVQVAPGRAGQPSVPDFSQPIAGGEQNQIAGTNDPSANSLNSAPGDLSSIPAGRHRVVNSHKFTIGYTLDDVGPSGVSNVELFITQNNGEKWWKYGDDPDKLSPLEIEVPVDGVYGFSIRVHSGAGLTTAAPLKGEKPELVVAVDSTPPSARLLPVERTPREPGKLSLRWTVADQNPDPRPIALYYSATPTGPWEPISGWQPNTGEYRWSVGPGLPGQLYIRMTARDAAGNTTNVQTPEPLVIDLSRPTARIVDVAPAGQKFD